MLNLSGKIQSIHRLDGGSYGIEVAGSHTILKGKTGSKYSQGDWVNIRAEHEDDGLMVKEITKTTPINETPRV
jgi:hypothetical protein